MKSAVVAQENSSANKTKDNIGVWKRQTILQRSTMVTICQIYIQIIPLENQLI